MTGALEAEAAMVEGVPVRSESVGEEARLILIHPLIDSSRMVPEVSPPHLYCID